MSISGVGISASRHSCSGNLVEWSAEVDGVSAQWQAVGGPTEDLSGRYAPTVGVWEDLNGRPSFGGTVSLTGPGGRQFVMTSLRKTALVAGSFYLITFVSSIPALFILEPVLHHANYIVSSGADTHVFLGCLLDLINAIAAVGSAVALFPVVKRQHEGIALGFVTSRLFEAAIVVIGVVSLLAVVTLRRDIGGVATDHSSLIVGGRALVAVRGWTFLLGPSLIPGFNALLLGYLLYRSGLVPRWIPTLGLIGAPLLIASVTISVFRGNHPVAAIAGIATAPIFVWELSLGVWLVVKGFKACPITADLLDE